jgi:hypothetical protein
MPRHKIWRLQYREDRYLRGLSQTELNQRIRDLVLNQIVLTETGKFGLIEINEVTRHLPEVWTHVLEEMHLRHGPYPAGFTPDARPRLDPIPGVVGDLARKTADALAQRREHASVLVKFGKRTHMESLFTRGAMRVQPASFYSRQDLNGAMHDDELRLTLSVTLSREDIVRLVKNPEAVPPDGPEQRLDTEFQAQSDYWIYCVSTSVAPRLFADFHADACVIIHSPTVFTDRLRRAESGDMRNARFASGPAVYIDPFRPKDSLVFVPFAKHFRYSYQKEHRFAWLPRARSEKLTHVDLEVGPLHDVAELIVA